MKGNTALRYYAIGIEYNVNERQYKSTKQDMPRICIQIENVQYAKFEFGFNNKSKHDHETTLYCFVRDDLSTDWKLRFMAIDRRQARLKRSNIDPFHGHVLIQKYSPFILPTTHSRGQSNA